MAKAASPAVVIPATVVPRNRVRIFVDFWNFSLAVRGRDSNFRINWAKVAPTLVREAGALADPAIPAHYEAMHVYGSYDPNKPNDAKLKHWFTNILDKMPGISATLVPRQKKKGHPKCPHCQVDTLTCHNCGKDMRGTEEKGVDTRIATDLISLAWSNSYDVAVLLSADRDFVPVAEFLQSKSIKVIHGAFPPSGSQLSQKCWGNIKMPALMPAFRSAVVPRV